METIEVCVGSIVAGGSNQVVEFVGEQLAQRTEYGAGRIGGITDTRGVTETLYRTDDGRLIVHVDKWSRWRGEPNTETLHVVTEEDLQPGGRFEFLGVEAGMGRPLTLDEALGLTMLDSEISHIIKLDSIAGGGLPCGCGNGHTICGRKAKIGMLDPDPDRPGRWVLTPICRVCVSALAVMYEGVPERQEA
jgi:YD repeat-containing protein